MQYQEINDSLAFLAIAVEEPTHGQACCGLD